MFYLFSNNFFLNPKILFFIFLVLMEMLEKSKLTEKPQIVGLTASMGVGDTSLDIIACYQHMLTLCSNLHSETISTVRHQLDNLKSHVMPPVDGKVEEKNFFENFLEIF